MTTSTEFVRQQPRSLRPRSTFRKKQNNYICNHDSIYNSNHIFSSLRLDRQNGKFQARAGPYGRNVISKFTFHSHRNANNLGCLLPPLLVWVNGLLLVPPRSYKVSSS